MANQAIALQARAPQTDILGGAIRNNAQMINMMAQQQAAQRQNAIADQTMQIQRAKEARETAMAGPQLAKAQSEAGSARQDFVVKAVGHALHTSVNNPTDETLDRAAMTLADVGLDPAEIEREITPIKQLPLDQRKGALMQSILSDPNSKAAFEATLPKPKEMRLKDRTILIDENPLSSTFNQPIRTEMVGMTPAQANPTGKVVQDASGNYFTVDSRTGTAKPVTMGGGGGIPGQRGGGSSALATNPGALKDSPFAQSQPGYAGAAGGFATFETPEAGVRAQENLLRGAYIGKGHNTISKIVDRYAPQGAENSAASVANYKQYIAQQTGIDINSPISAAQVPAVAKAMREFETGQRASAAPAAGGGQLQGPTKGKPAANPAAEAKAVQRKTALTNELQMALDLVTDPSNSSAFQSSKKSWWDNQAQSVLHGKFNPKTAEFGVHTALPGGVAHKSVWDRVTKHLIGAMYQTIEPGQAGMNRAVASQKMHIQMMGGGDNPSRETLIEAIKSTAADYGIKLNERGGGGGGGGGQAPAKPAAVKRTAGGASVSDW